MLLYSPSEHLDGECRTALTPATVTKLKNLGLDIAFESGFGEKADFPDEVYRAAGAESMDRAAGFSTADFVFCVNPPSIEEIASMKRGAMLAGFLEPFHVHLGEGDAPTETAAKAPGNRTEAHSAKDAPIEKPMAPIRGRAARSPRMVAESSTRRARWLASASARCRCAAS